MFHTAAYYESIDGGGVLHNIAGIQDQALSVNGDNVRVPQELPMLAGAAALTAASTLTGAQVQSPSLRTLANPDISPVVNAVTFGDPPEIFDIFQNPQPLTPAEDLEFLINSDNTGATAEYGVVWLSDGNTQPVSGNIFTVKCTADITLAAGQWVNGNLTFTQTLPAGQYQVVGLRAEGTNLVSARLVFPGGGFRPGVPAVNAVSDLDHSRFRNGMAGIFGTFTEDSPPTLDALGVTDTSQTIYLDLIKT